MLKNKKGKIYLSGGGGIEQTYELDDIFVKSLTGRRICYIPLAGTLCATGYEESFDWFIRMLNSHRDDFFEVDMITEPDQLNKVELQNYEAIYMGGGNTYRLRNFLNDSGLSLKLRSYFDEGGVIYGGSAGAIVLGESLAAVKKEDKSQNQLDEGLGLVGEYSFLCHFSENSESDALAFVDKYKKPLLALSENSGIVFDGGKNQLQCFGSGLVVVFDGETRRTCRAGEVLAI